MERFTLKRRFSLDCAVVQVDVCILCSHNLQARLIPIVIYTYLDRHKTNATDWENMHLIFQARADVRKSDRKITQVKVVICCKLKNPERIHKSLTYLREI